MHVLYNCSRSPPKAFIVRPWLRQVLSWPPTSLSTLRFVGGGGAFIFPPPAGIFSVTPMGRRKCSSVVLNFFLQPVPLRFSSCVLFFSGEQ